MKHGNLDGNGIAEIQNYNFQRLQIAPTTDVYEGRFYFNTIEHTLYVYNGTEWVNALTQGKVYLEGTGINIENDTISVDTDVIATKDDLDDYIPLSQKGANDGVATLDSNGKVPNSQLPAFVDDVIDAYIVGSTPLANDWLSRTSGGTALIPETDKIYVILSSGEYLNKTYRWSGTTYVAISDVNNATENARGIIQIATQSEVNTGTDDTKAVTSLKLATLLGSKVYTTNNPALTQSGGICTFVVTHNLNSTNVTVDLYEVSTGDKVMYDTTITSANVVTLKILSATNIVADTYRAVIKA